MARILILGGTGWLGATLANTALDAGHDVACLARGESGGFPEGSEAIVADRGRPEAYAGAADRDWDLVVELTRRPDHARGAAEALAARAGHWVFVSSCSVYSRQDRPGAAEDAALLTPLSSTAEYLDELYGEAKAGCEWLTLASAGGKALLVRPGLIGGPGDPTARTTYWPLRFAAGGPGPVLVPDDSADPRFCQIIDVRDLAAFILDAGLAARTGAVNAVGPETPLAEVLRTAAHAAGYAGATAAYPLSRMQDDGVAPWTGPRSLPLVLPAGTDYAGFARRSDARAVAFGLRRRPLAETFADIVAEHGQGDAPTGSGLTSSEERELLDALLGCAQG
jgi:2'-hydroxyisoflavone reductase